MFTSAGGCRCHVFRQQLPGHPACLVELQTPNLGEAATGQRQPKLSAGRRINCPSKFQIVIEVLAEGWAKSLADWHKQNKLPISFNPPAASKSVHPDLVPPLTALKADVPQKEM